MTGVQLCDALRTELAHGRSQDDNLLGWINEAIKDTLRSEAFGPLRASSEINTVAAVRTIDAPTDAAMVLGVWYRSTTLTTSQPTRELWEKDAVDLRQMFIEDASGIPSHYHLVWEDDPSGDGELLQTIALWPIPDDVYRMIVDYTREDFTITDIAASNHLTVHWPRVIIYRAKWYGANALGDDDLADRAEAQHQKVYAAMDEHMRRRTHEPIQYMPWSTGVLLDRRWRRE